ncbi:MAG: thioesterase family protein [Rhizobiaceae bacterium]
MTSMSHDDQSMRIPTPYVSEPMLIPSEWCNTDGALRTAYYGVVFDRRSDGAFELLGLGEEYAKNRNLTFYTAESHICFIKPVYIRDSVTVSFQLIDHDEKRLRSYQEMRHVDGWLVATTEVLSLHVDLSVRKVVPFPDDIRAKIENMAKAHARLELPVLSGKHIDLHSADGGAL